MEAIKTLAQFQNAINHPYRVGEFFIDSNDNIFQVPENEKGVIDLLFQAGENNLTMYYSVNWDDESLFAENGTQIQPVYLKD